jgi:predicted XRE-type DNA-binding protein
MEGMNGASNEATEQQIGLRVAQLANRLKVKQTRIAQDCEISRISVNRFFRGRSEIRASDLVNVLKVLGIDLQQEIDKRLQPPTY